MFDRRRPYRLARARLQPRGRPVSPARAGSLRVCLAIAAIGCVSANAAWAEDEPDRGQALYENHCGSCHGKALHRRDGDRARVHSREELYGWVATWSVHAGTPWGEEEIDSVTSYLSRKVYEFTR